VNLIFFQIWLFLFAKSTLRQNATFTQLCNVFLLPQASGRACVNFGCTHPIDGLFWSLSIYYFLRFFSKYDCWVNNLIMPLYQFFFFGVVTCLSVSQGSISLWNVKKIHMTNFLNEICLINIQMNSLNSFKSY
jgi:energy-converting hydrogenase Eha subunit G